MSIGVGHVVRSWRLRQSLANESYNNEILRNDPLFIVGCGRSGTTALGNALGAISNVVYLNEPRDGWAAAVPPTDIWSFASLLRRGRLQLSGTSEKNIQLLRRFFQKQYEPLNKWIVEKTPENAFRISLIRTAFPHAHFVWIVRDPTSVTRSIAARNRVARPWRAGWPGVFGYKWRQIQITESHYGLEPIASSSPEDRALSEWRLFLRAQEEYLQDPTVLHINYDQLVETPRCVISRIWAHMTNGEILAENELAQAANMIARPKSEPCWDAPNLDDKDRDILERLFIRWQRTPPVSRGKEPART